MKQRTTPSLLQKAFMLVMAAMVLSLALFYPLQAEEIAKKSSPTETTISNVSYSNAPDLTPAPEPRLVVPVLFFALPKVWALIQAALSPDIQEYRASFEQLFIPKINFVFVSTLAP
jgi:hypothetical protein